MSCPVSGLPSILFEKLAKDISPDVPVARSGFNGVTFAHNARSKDEVVEIIRRAETAGARIIKEPQDVFWGGFSGYFTDLDGYYWEVAWGPYVLLGYPVQWSFRS